MSKINYKGTEYDFITVSQDPLTVTVQFDSHGTTQLIRRNGEWSASSRDYLPNDASIDELGRLIEEAL